jgi:hypothetical protein
MMNVGVLWDVKYCSNYVVSMMYILGDIIALCNLRIHLNLFAALNVTFFENQYYSKNIS